jgi:hypothetical protein
MRITHPLIKRLLIRVNDSRRSKQTVGELKEFVAYLYPVAVI